MDKIKSLILSTNPDDKLLAIHLLDNLSDDKWQMWVEENMRPESGNNEDEDTWEESVQSWNTWTISWRE